MEWASEFRDIPSTLAERPDLRAAMKALLAQHEIPVKVTEGSDRRDRRKAILGALFGGEISLEQRAHRATQVGAHRQGLGNVAEVQGPLHAARG